MLAVGHDVEGAVRTAGASRSSTSGPADRSSGTPDEQTDEPSGASDNDRLLAPWKGTKARRVGGARGTGPDRITVPGREWARVQPDGRSWHPPKGGPVLIWPTFEPVQEGPPSAADLDRAWEALAGKSDEAFEAIRRLATHPAQALPYLKGKIGPVQSPDPATIEKLIVGLDHREFRKREAATFQLAQYGERCRGSLERALTNGPSPECRERLEKLLAAEETLSPATLAVFRSVEAVEYARTPAAADVLKYWAGGADGAALTREAAAALKRLEEEEVAVLRRANGSDVPLARS